MIKPINLKPANLSEWETSRNDIQLRIDKKQQQIVSVSDSAHHFQMKLLLDDLKGLQKYHDILLKMKDSMPEATFSQFGYKRVLESKKSCSFPCSPSDYHSGGKCDINGCYASKEA